MPCVLPQPHRLLLGLLRAVHQQHGHGRVGCARCGLVPVEALVDRVALLREKNEAGLAPAAAEHGAAKGGPSPAGSRPLGLARVPPCSAGAETRRPARGALPVAPLPGCGGSPDHLASASPRRARLLEASRIAAALRTDPLHHASTRGIRRLSSRKAAGNI
jgi:hypothetical protein